MRGFPHFSFWISIALAVICFSHIVINRKNIPLYITQHRLDGPWSPSKSNEVICAGDLLYLECLYKYLVVDVKRAKVMKIKQKETEQCANFFVFLFRRITYPSKTCRLRGQTPPLAFVSLASKSRKRRLLLQARIKKRMFGLSKESNS